MYQYVRSKLELFLENNVRFRAMGKLWELPPTFKTALGKWRREPPTAAA